MKRTVHYPNFHHAIFHESGRETPVAEVRRFILERFAEDQPLPSLRHADTGGYTQAEHDRLAKPLPFYCTKNLNFRAQKAFLKTVGLLSRGIQIGWKSGFDSGASLDHVYQNRPTGTTPLGRVIDYFYLNAIGWRGIRQRKIHLQELLTRTLRHVGARNNPLSACSTSLLGRGVTCSMCLHNLKLPNVSALLHDQNEAALEIGPSSPAKWDCLT